MRAGGKYRGIGFDPAGRCLDRNKPVAVKREAFGFGLHQPASRLEDGVYDRLDQALRVHGMAVVRDVFPEFCIRREMRIKGAKLFLVEFLPDDTVLAPERPAARLRRDTFPGAVA